MTLVGRYHRKHGTVVVRPHHRSDPRSVLAFELEPYLMTMSAEDRLRLEAAIEKMSAHDAQRMRQRLEVEYLKRGVRPPQRHIVYPTNPYVF